MKRNMLLILTAVLIVAIGINLPVFSETTPIQTSPLQGKALVAIGDSITYGANNKGVSHITKVATRNSMSLTNYAVSGGTLVNTKGRSYIGGSIDTIINKHKSLDYLILSGGFNDSQLSIANPIGKYDTTDYSGKYDTGTILGSLETVIYKSVQAYPAAKIGCIITYKSTYETGWTKNREVMKEVLDKWGIPCIDITLATHLINSPVLNMRNVIFTDKVHPNDVGYEMIADAVEAWMKTL